MVQNRKTPNLYGQWMCPDCKEFKDPEGFYNNRRSTNGLSTYCKECQLRRQKYYTPAAKQERFEARQAEAIEDLQRQLEELKAQMPLGPPGVDVGPTSDYDTDEALKFLTE